MARVLAKSFTAGCMALFLFAVTFQATADVDTWLGKVDKAYGGVKQVLEVNSFQQYGVTFSKMRGHEGKVTRSYRYPDHLRIAIDYGELDLELRLVAGSRSWRQNKASGEPFYSAMILQATRLGLPAVLFAHKKYVKDGGEYKNAQGKTLHLLEIQFHTQNHISVGIDPQTGRIVESASTIIMDNFKMQFGTSYDDFRKVDGRLFAFKEIHYVMGRETGYTNLESIVVEPLPDTLFYPENGTLN